MCLFAYPQKCHYYIKPQEQFFRFPRTQNQLQKIFGTSFNRMDNMFRDMQLLGIVSGTQQGTKRKVLVTELELEEILNNL